MILVGFPVPCTHADLQEPALAAHQLGPEQTAADFTESPSVHWHGVQSWHQ